MFPIIFLLLFPLFAKGEVSNFANCPQFFFNRNPPTVLQDNNNNNRYKQICQCLQHPNQQPQYFYATLYDTVNRIPVYSAYEFKYGRTPRIVNWKIEPQLDNGQAPCMTGDGRGITGLGQRQALNADYDGVGQQYHKGHLYPASHAPTPDVMISTFTLTNAAPQVAGFNTGQWREHEKNLKNILQQCAQAFVVTGVVPGNQNINNRVRVAQYYWSAYCCDNNGQYSSRGYIGPNQNGKVDDMTVQTLDQTLSNANHYNSPFTVFHQQC